MTSRTFNDAFGDLIRHLKFRMRKVLETRNSNQATRLSAGRAWVSGHETNWSASCSAVALEAKELASIGDQELEQKEPVRLKS